MRSFRVQSNGCVLMSRNAGGFGSTLLSIGVAISGRASELCGIYNRSDWRVGSVEWYQVECATKWVSGTRRRRTWTTLRTRFKRFIIAWKDDHLKRRSKRNVYDIVCYHSRERDMGVIINCVHGERDDSSASRRIWYKESTTNREFVAFCWKETCNVDAFFSAIETPRNDGSPSRTVWKED